MDGTGNETPNRQGHYREAVAAVAALAFGDCNTNTR
jgi:hypothetical protein